MIKKKSPKERRIILKHADDPKYSNKIGCYLKNGGYSMLKKAFKMKPEEIGEEVLKSGVRGRGGAGFPAGMKWKFLDRKSGKPIYLICLSLKVPGSDSSALQIK